MQVQQFLAHHGIGENPFGQEDAQCDPVFKRRCLDGTCHPAWDKIFGSPADAATAIVFGEKGSGKTALRLQIVEHATRHNLAHPDQRLFVIEYDDFNPFLDSFCERLWGRNRATDRAITSWRLWDHIDAILTLGVTQLADRLLQTEPHAADQSFGVDPDRISRLSRLKRRDLLLLAAIYDHTLAAPRQDRWRALRRKLRFSTWRAQWDFALGAAVSLAVPAIMAYTGRLAELTDHWIPWLILLAGWLPWLWRQAGLLWKASGVARQVRVVDLRWGLLRTLLSGFERKELADQPLPCRQRSDDRYELLNKFLGVLRDLGFQGVFVIVDRVDEPHLVNGSPARMRDLLWPLLDNKLLKHPGVGFKLLLPIEVSYHLVKEDQEFFEHSRLDKQNMIRSLQWTGESLFDVASDRVRACAAGNGAAPKFRDLFDASISDVELIASLDRLRVPRHMFKFLYRLLVDHCNRFTEAQPSWKISRETWQTTLALSLRDLQEFDRGLSAG